MGMPRTRACVCVWLGAILTVTGTCRTVLAEEDARSACATTAEHAQVLRSTHKLKEAQQALLDCSRQTCPEVVRKDCMQWLSEVTTAIPSIVIRALDPAGHEVAAPNVWVDGTNYPERLDGRALALEPGTHRLRFKAVGMIPIDQEIVVREGENKRSLTVQFVSSSSEVSSAKSEPVGVSGSPARTALPYVLGGAGLVALGSFAYFGIKGESELSDLKAGCGATKSCSESQVDPARTHLRIADVSLGLSLVSFGVATWLFMSRHSTQPKDTTSLQVGVTPGQGQVKFRMAF